MTSAKVRKEVVVAALADMKALQAAIMNLSQTELDLALELESGGKRRRSVMKRLIRRSVRLAELRLNRELNTRYVQ